MRPKNLQKVTTKFGRAYTRAKKFDTRKEHWKGEFFAAVTQEIERERRLPRRTITTTQDKEWVKQHNPGYKLISSVQTEEGTQYLLEKDPRLIAFSYVNHEDGMVYQRGIQESGPSLDDERLQEEDPELWQEITEEIRVVKDPSTWTKDQCDRILPYMIPGTIRSKLIPPRPAKPEELAWNQSELH